MMHDPCKSASKEQQFFSNGTLQYFPFENCPNNLRQLFNEKKDFLYIFHIYFQIAMSFKMGIFILHNHIHMVYSKYLLPPASLLICRFKIRFFRNSSFGLRRSSTSSSSEEDGA